MTNGAIERAVICLGFATVLNVASQFIFVISLEITFDAVIILGMVHFMIFHTILVNNFIAMLAVVDIVAPDMSFLI